MCHLLLWPHFFYLAQPRSRKAFCVAAVSVRRLPAATLTFSRDAVFLFHYDTLNATLHHWVSRAMRQVVDVTPRDVVWMDCFELWILRLRKKKIFRGVNDSVVVAVVVDFHLGMHRDELVLKRHKNVGVM